MTDILGLNPLRNRFTAWFICNRPGKYIKGKKLGTHSGEHRLKDASEFLAIHAKLVESGEGITGLRERYNLWMLARKTERFTGALAEVGVFRGGSAMVLAAAKGDAALHLFDTFAGMPETDARCDGIFSAGMFKDADLKSVQARLAPWSNVVFHPGFFPDSAADVDPTLPFKFVNIDVDIRSATCACLEYFYPRVVKGGFIVIHDYNDTGVPGAKTAVDEFMQDKVESVIELWDTQALIIKA